MKAPKFGDGCDRVGVPGTVCGRCTIAAHESHVRRVRSARTQVEAQHGIRCDAATMIRQVHDDALAAWSGADLLLGICGEHPALWRHGFEVPSFDRGRW